MADIRRVRSRIRSIFLLLVLVVGGVGGGVAAGTVAWQGLGPGMEVGYVIPPGTRGTLAAVTVLRIDLRYWELMALGPTVGSGQRGVEAWAKMFGCVAAINAGGLEGSGQLRFGGFVRSGRVEMGVPRRDFLSVAAFDPRREGLAAFRLFDLDAAGGADLHGLLRDFGSVVQNPRLIRRPGVNAAPVGDRVASATALGEDAAGRVLFVFTRAPLSMRDLAATLISGGLGIVAAQYLESGPEAQLYFRAGGVERRLVGSFETAYHESDDNRSVFNVPGALAVRARHAPPPL